MSGGVNRRSAQAELYEAERRVLKIQTKLHRLNPVLRGWCTYFQPGVSSATFHFLRAFAWPSGSDGCAANTPG